MLIGEKIGLRAIEVTDLPQLVAWRNKPELRQYFREYRELNNSNQKEWFEKYVLQDRNTEMFTVIDLKTKELVGACGLCYIDWINRNADFSIYIGKDNLYIDDQYAIDAAKLLIKYGFEELNLHRLWSEIYDFDEAKKVMFEKLGFKLEGRHKETHWTHGRWCDSLFWGLLRDEIAY